MKKNRSSIGWVMIMLLLGSCSTQKNTGASRSFHEMKVYHNIYFNGKTSYTEGLETIGQANTDDYSIVIPLYPVSNHKAAEASKSQMDQTIEKCRKCIKLHSIHAKPKKINHKKSRDPNYKQWLESKEFNNQMWRAWMLLGQAEFHKGEFLESVGTFNYVSRLYPNDKNIVALCQLWVVRAYGELGWIYEAEDMLGKIVVDDISHKDLPFYSAVSADIAIKGGHYREAIAFVKVAREGETKKQYRPRFEFVLGELYERDHQNASACAAYKRVNKMHSKDIELDFNAKIRAAELSADTTRSLRNLRRLARLYKYREKQDQLFGAIGNIYLAHKDTIQALAAYEKAIQSSTQNGSHKAAALLTAGDLYYQRHQYTPAEPCYSELVQILDHEHPAYALVEKRSSILSELVAQTQTIELQDSLQYLATLSQEEQLTIVEGIIERLIEQEKQDSLQAAQDARDIELEQAGGGLKSVNTLNMLGGGGGDQSWYFYNAQLMKNGKQEFLRKWGNRPLEDNWRLKSKGAVSTFQQPIEADLASIEEDTTALSQMDEQEREMMQEDAPIAEEMDPHQPQYYLQQIPRTEEDFATSNTLIADALYNLVGIYRDKAQDIPMSQATFAEFLRRFPQDERQLNLFYMQHLTATKMEDVLMSDSCRDAILHRYPQSHEAAIVGNPNYASMMKQMLKEQDSLYYSTYNAYVQGRFAEVKVNKQYVEDTYPLSTLMPQFLFLNAIAVAKTEGQDGFIGALREMVERYPTSELGAIAKDMLAMMGQGMESQQDGSVSSLADKRGLVEEQDTIPADVHFSDERQERSLVVVVLPQDESILNTMLYEIALFNFTQFLIRDFDMTALPVFIINQSALQISGFESLDEAQWYLSLVQGDAELMQKIAAFQGKILSITETNYQLLGNPFTLEDYIEQGY